MAFGLSSGLPGSIGGSSRSRVGCLCGRTRVASQRRRNAPQMHLFIDPAGDMSEFVFNVLVSGVVAFTGIVGWQVNAAEIERNRARDVSRLVARVH